MSPPNSIILEYFVKTPKEESIKWFLDQIFHVVDYNETHQGYTFKRFKDPAKASKPPSTLGLKTILSKHIADETPVQIINLDWVSSIPMDLNNMNWMRHKVM